MSRLFQIYTYVFWLTDLNAASCRNGKFLLVWFVTWRNIRSSRLLCSDPLKRCKALSSALRDRFLKCPLFPGKLPALASEAEDAADFDEEDEVFVSAVMSRYMESKCKRKEAIGADTLRWALSPQHFLLARKGRRKSSGSGESREESSSGGGSRRLSRCSSATSYDAFFSVKTRFSRSSSLNKVDSRDFRKQSVVVLELLRYEGWPFGLCKKAFLLPPLPKSPSDSWSWRKGGGGGIATVHG